MNNAPDRLDISVEARRAQVNIVPDETPEERASRIRNFDAQQRDERFKSMALFAVGLFLLVGLGLVSAYEVFLNKAADPEQVRWCRTILFSLVSGGASFFVGKKIGEAKD